MKYIKYLLIILSIVIMTGCGYNNSAESVAKEMAKRLSKGNYKNIEELLLIEKNAFIDEKSFEAYLESQNINLKGNKKIEVIKDDNTSDDPNEKIIKIKIDNDYVLNVKTTKELGKWYVDISDKMKKNVKISVPANSKVTLNNKKLSEDYKENSDLEKVNCGKYCTEMSISLNTNMDVYTIPQMLIGKYDIKVENENGTYAEEINIYGTSKEPIYIVLTPNDKYDKKIKNYLEESIENILSYVESGDKQDEISKYYAENIREDVMAEYNKIRTTDKYTTFVIYYKNFKLESLNINSAYIYGDKIIVNGSYKYSYDKERTYIKYMQGTSTNKNTKNYEFTVVLVKDNSGNFLMHLGTRSIVFGRI